MDTPYTYNSTVELTKLGLQIVVITFLSDDMAYCHYGLHLQEQKNTNKLLQPSSAPCSVIEEKKALTHE